jgi:uncharacterized protein (UPF0335 family)
MTDNTSHRVAADELRKIVESLELSEARKKDETEHQKEVMAAAKGRGYDTATIRKALARRKLNPDDVASGDAMLDLYESTLNGSR